MITGITGMPGDGKTLFAVGEIIDILVHTDKFVVTNARLKLPELAAYVAARSAGPFVLDDRLRVIPDSEVFEFYRFRSGGLVLDESPDRRNPEASQRMPRDDFNSWMRESFVRIGERPDYSRPCVYFIDETQDFFSARDWASNGRSTLFYATKHRHLHDEVFLITQSFDQVEKQLRNLISETHVVRNQLRRRIGPVRLRPVFRVRTFYGVPAGPGSKPFADTTFHLDAAGIAGCYETTGALGVHRAPESIRNKGVLPWWSLWVAGIVVVLALFSFFVAAPYLAGKGARSFVSGPAHVPVHVQNVRPVGVVARPVVGLADRQSAFRSDRPVSRGSNPVFALGVGDDGVRVVGVLRRGARTDVVLSDGSVVTEQDVELGTVQRAAVWLAGRKFPVMPEVHRVAAVASPVHAEGVRGQIAPGEERSDVSGLQGAPAPSPRPVLKASHTHQSGLGLVPFTLPQFSLP